MNDVIFNLRLRLAYFLYDANRWLKRHLPPKCRTCGDTGAVCENHPDKPWGGFSCRRNACHCGGAGEPCPKCCRGAASEESGRLFD